MKTIAVLIFGLLAGATVLPATPVHASDCGSAAQRVARNTGGQVLNVVPSADGQRCDVTVRVPGKNGKPPRVVTRTVRR